MTHAVDSIGEAAGYIQEVEERSVSFRVRIGAAGFLVNDLREGRSVAPQSGDQSAIASVTGLLAKGSL